MSYILVINVLRFLSVKVGRLGLIKFKPGLYVYIGSAKRNFLSRIRRHLAKNKRRFWHIDYLLTQKEARVERVYFTKRRDEYQLTRGLMGFPYIKDFGSSDCRSSSHLFYIEKRNRRFYDFLKDNYLTLWKNPISD